MIIMFFYLVYHHILECSCHEFSHTKEMVYTYYYRSMIHQSIWWIPWRSCCQIWQHLCMTNEHCMQLPWVITTDRCLWLCSTDVNRARFFADGWKCNSIPQQGFMRDQNVLPVKHILEDTWMLTVMPVYNFQMCLMTWNALQTQTWHHLHSLSRHN